MILILISVASVFFFKLGREKKGELWIPWLFTGILLGSWIFGGIYAFVLGLWSYTWGLPLQLCDLAVFLIIASLFSKSRWIWYLAYYWILCGSIPAVLVPDLPVDFPNPFYLLFFLVHGGVIVLLFYLVGKGRQIERSSIKQVWIMSHLYVIVVALFNLLFQTNYLFLCAKPSQFSPLDWFGPWPIYLFALECYFIVALYFWYAVSKKLNRL